MFERFTERARQVVVLAQQDALALGHGHVGTEHILLGLARDDQGIAARVLGRLGITADLVQAQLVQTVAAGEEPPSGRQIPFTPRSKQVFELALREALSLGHNYIATEHILLALVRENDGVATRILDGFGVDAEKIRSAVFTVLGGPTAPRRTGHFSIGVRQFYRTIGFDWSGATLLWRPEGLELRVPLHLDEGSMATFAADEVWSREPLVRMRREIWSGWLAVASPTLLDDIEPPELRRMLDAAARRALDRRESDRGRVEDFLRRLREEA